LVLADKGDVIEDQQQVILVELGDRALERELAPRDLQALYEIAGAFERLNSTRQPFSTNARPMAAARCLAAAVRPAS
jgi:hypothetical protein